MDHVDWTVKGIQFGTCNCAFGCPCQFEAPPTEGHCRGMEAIRIEEGHFGEVPLDGLMLVVLYAWPGAVHEGDGEMQAIVDARADTAQREALVKIVHGEETEPGATHWWVYRSAVTRVHDPVFAPIDLEVDIEARTARLDVAGIIEASGAPIVSPATGEEHRARIVIPGGMEFTEAEMGAGTTRASGPITLDFVDRYGQFNRIHQTTAGPVRACIAGSNES